MPTEQDISELRKLVEFEFYDIDSYKEGKERDEMKNKIKKDLKSIPDKTIEKIAKADEVEKFKDGKGFPVKVKVGFPKPNNKFKISYELYNQSIEENYFWLLNQLRSDLGMNEVIKITDIMTASEQSSIWGQAQQRQSLQQGQVSQYLKGISDMVRSGLFQLVREIRVVNEKLEYYKDGQGNDYALKGSWIDQVEGGAKSVVSIYGMAQNLNMVALPDLFFRTYIKEQEPEKAQKDIKKSIDELKKSFNDKVLEVLERKLIQYVTWRHHSKKELEQRRKLTVKYLRQHYQTIKLYMSWVKPYLKNVKRLSMNDKQIDSPDIISAFESNVIEIEIMTRRRSGSFKTSKTEKSKDEQGNEITKTKTEDKDMYAVVLLNMTYRAKPSLNYQADSYANRGPIYVGKTEIELRSYVWDNKQCENYKKMRDSEIFAMIGDFDETLKQIFDEFGEELKKYLSEAGETFEEKKEEEKKKEYVDNPLEIFKGIFLGFKEVFGPLFPEIGKKGPPASEADEKKAAEGAAKGIAEFAIWNAYKNYKKSHGMLSW